MTKIELSQSVAILANIGVIAGIVFLGYELRQNTQAIEISAADGYLTSIHEVNIMVMADDEMAEIIAKARDPDIRLSSSEDIKINTLFSTALRNYQHAFYLNQRGFLDPILWHTQQVEMGATLRQNPRFLTLWERRKGAYDDEFNELLEYLILAPNTE